MIVTIHQPQYMPWLGYFDKISKADIFVLLDDVQFKKNEWQNRNRIRTAQGWQWLTVPVQHDFGIKINELRIDNKTPWRMHHLKALELNYGKSLYFNEIYSAIEKVLTNEWEYLGELNVELVKVFISLLGIKTKIVLSSAYQTVDHKTLRLVDLCKQLGADTYLSGEGGSAYLDEEQFKAQDIKIIVQKYEHPIYPQLWMNKDVMEFITHLSILDLLFNCGQESLNVITSMKGSSN